MSPTHSPPDSTTMGASGARGRLIRVALLLICIVTLTILAYAPGLSGGFVFDDYPNIVDNALVQPARAGWSELVAAALSSPSSDLKRPLSSLTFALDYLVAGLDPSAMKVTNLGIHVANGLILFFLLSRIISICNPNAERVRVAWAAGAIAMAWLTLPINLTAVLYVVQRMESLANLCVLAGLLTYLLARLRMHRVGRGAWLAGLSLASFTILGVGFKETAVLLPLYACALEWIVFRGRTSGEGSLDRRVVVIFIVFLLLPLLAGGAILLPRVIDASAWATRDFTLKTRLLSEPRVVLSYILWTVCPLPAWLSFYHDEFRQSVAMWSPRATLPAIAAVLASVAALPWLRNRRPLMALGVAWFFGCHVLTATVIPLELIYEHRNYFASIGVLIALYDAWSLLHERALGARPAWRVASLAVPAIWIAMSYVVTTTSAFAWGDPLRLARALAERGPDSPRAQYEYGRALIIASRYQSGSPLLDEATTALERASVLPGSSILPEQALIFVNSRMHRPVNQAWWESIYRKLSASPATVQDDSSLLALESCAREGQCDIPSAPLVRAFEIASHNGRGSARLLGSFGQHLWSVDNDRDRAIRMAKAAVEKAPDEPAYRINLARMLMDAGQTTDAAGQIDALDRLNIGGRLDAPLTSLRARLRMAQSPAGADEGGAVPAKPASTAHL